MQTFLKISIAVLFHNNLVRKSVRSRSVVFSLYTFCTNSVLCCSAIHSLYAYYTTISGLSCSVVLQSVCILYNQWSVPLLFIVCMHTVQLVYCPVLPSTVCMHTVQLEYCPVLPSYSLHDTVQLVVCPVLPSIVCMHTVQLVYCPLLLFIVCMQLVYCPVLPSIVCMILYNKCIVLFCHLQSVCKLYNQCTNLFCNLVKVNVYD